MGPVETAYEETPVPEPGPGKKKGRKKRGKVLALVDRLKEHKAAVCLFIKDFAVPFDKQPGRTRPAHDKSKDQDIRLFPYPGWCAGIS